MVILAMREGQSWAVQCTHLLLRLPSPRNEDALDTLWCDGHSLRDLAILAWCLTRQHVAIAPMATA
jgi:hypothetical protein